MIIIDNVNKGEIWEDLAEKLDVDLDEMTDKQFADYIEACKEKGFVVDAKSDSSSFDAFDEEGYMLSIDYYSSFLKMEIDLNAPIEMKEISWPNGKAGKMLPVPKSTVGKFSYENDDSFFLYLGNTSPAEYAEYVNACSEKGFNVDYSKGDDYYYANNSENYHVSLKYLGNNIMSINITAPFEEDDIETSTIDSSTEKPTEEPGESVDYSTEKPKENVEVDKAEKEPNNDASNKDGIGSDFKAAMDSHEKFMDEYIAFMKKYEENSSDFTLLDDYLDYLDKYGEFVEDFAKWEDEEMNDAETAYYIDVQTRVNKKLLEAAL